MEPKHQPIEKEDHLNQTSFQMWIFPGGSIHKMLDPLPQISSPQIIKVQMYKLHSFNHYEWLRDHKKPKTPKVLGTLFPPRPQQKARTHPTKTRKAQSRSEGSNTERIDVGETVPWLDLMLEPIFMG